VYGANPEIGAQASGELTATPTSLDGIVGYPYWASKGSPGGRAIAVQRTTPGSIYGF
jgi:hypothetical protein